MFEENQDESNIKINYQIQKVKNPTHFFTVENCIQYYENNQEFVAKEMKCQYGERIQQFIASGYENSNRRENVSYYRVFFDTYNNTYEVKSLLKENYTSLEDINIENNPEEIVANNNNILKYERLTTEDLCRRYLRYYNDLEINDVEYAYELLNNEYKEKRFPEIKDFNKFIEDSEDILQQISLSQYAEPQAKDDLTIYILKDQYNHFYIFEEDSIMNFTVKLDEYTITSDEFKNNYKSLKEAEKTSANIGIFIQMINNRDYTHAYEKLAEGFKNNYFKTQEEFENYIKSNWYQNIGYDITHYSNEGKIYIYDITLKNLKGREIETTERTFNIRLSEEDDTEFEISFNI